MSAGQPFNPDETGVRTMPTPSGHTTAIRASHVIGARVENAQREHLGKIEDLVLDKVSNSILFVVVGFGGVLGVGERYHPMPWAVLEYDPDVEAYVVPYTREELALAPSDTIDELTRNDGMGMRDRTFAFYGVDRH
jgi:hypothetical protein